MSAVLCFVVLVLAVTIMLLGPSAQAQTCAQATLFYNDAGKQKLYVEADRFADTEFLGWGSEVCPLDSHKRWLTTWIEVRLESGDTGWVDEDDLLTEAAFETATLELHAVKVREMENLIIHVVRLEVRLNNLDVELLAASLAAGRAGSGSRCRGWSTGTGSEGRRADRLARTLRPRSAGQGT